MKETFEKRLKSTESDSNGRALNFIDTPDEIPPVWPGEKLPRRYHLDRLTKEEFLFLAENRSQITVESIYQLQVFKICSKFIGCSPKFPDCYERKSPEGNWTLPLKDMGIGYFSTFEEAETALHRCHITAPFHSALIRRLPIDRYLGAEWLEWWLYDGKGTLIDRSVCTPFFDEQPEYISGRYMGRKEGSLRFKKGDIVEVMDDRNPGQVYLGVVKSVPRTPERMWSAHNLWINHKRRERKPLPQFLSKISEGFFFVDASHDKYFIRDLESKWIRGEEPYKVFPPSLPVPDEAKENLHEAFNRRFAVSKRTPS